MTLLSYFLKERLIAPHRDELQSFTTLYEGASGVIEGVAYHKGVKSSIRQALVSNTVATGVSAGTSFLAAAGTSMAYGALFGSALPGVGTVIGAAVGIGVGIISYTLTDDFVDWLWG